jgi:predicted transcriptional regulator
MGVATFRFDKELEAEITRIASLEGRTKTEVVREALREYTAKKRKETPLSMADSMQAYIGAGRSKRTDLSAQTGQTIRGILLEKKKSRRL